MRSRRIFVLGTCLLALPATGAEYSWQVSAIRNEVETGAVVDADNVAVAATRYFAPVDDQVGPSAVAAFLSRSSHVAIGAFDNDERQAIPFSSLNGTPQTFVQLNELEGYTATGRYVWRRSGWYAGGGFESADGEQWFSAQAPDVTDVRGYRVTAGKYLGDSTSLELGIGTTETDTEQGLSFVCSVFVACITGIETTADDVALRAFHVGQIGRMSYSLGGGVVSTEIDLEFAHRPGAPRRAGHTVADSRRRTHRYRCRRAAQHSPDDAVRGLRDLLGRSRAVPHAPGRRAARLRALARRSAARRRLRRGGDVVLRAARCGARFVRAHGEPCVPRRAPHTPTRRRSRFSAGSDRGAGRQLNGPL